MHPDASSRARPSSTRAWRCARIVPPSSFAIAVNGPSSGSARPTRSARLSSPDSSSAGRDEPAGVLDEGDGVGEEALDLGPSITS